MAYQAFDNAKTYEIGDIVTYWGAYWQASRRITPPFLPWLQSGEVPGESDAWAPASPATVAAGDAYLDEAWHATAYAPNHYEAGLDVLGARPLSAPISAANVTNAAARAATAGKRAVSVGHKIARHLPRLAKRLIAVGNRAINKSASAASAAKKMTAKAAVMVKPKVTAVSVTRKFAPASATRAATTVKARPGMTTSATRAVTQKALIRGEVDAFEMQRLDPQAVFAAFQAMTDLATATEGLANIGTLADAVFTLVQQLDTAGKTDVANAGQEIINRIQSAADSFDPEDMSVVAGTANALRSIQTDATAWQSAAQAALAAAPGATGPGAFDPGTPGGGGGGGGGAGPSDEESAPSGGGGSSEGEDTDVEPSEESSAVERYRASGGTWDPFEEGGGDEGAQEAYEADREDLDRGGEASEADVDAEADAEAREVESDMSAAVAAFRESGEDPFADDDNVVGLQYSDYHFEWSDLFLPHQALQRTMEEKEAKDRAVVADFNTSAATAGQGKPSPALARKLAAAKKKLLLLQQQEAARRAAFASAQHAQAQQPQSDFAEASQSEGDAVMGADDLDLIMGELVDAGFTLEEAADIAVDQFQHQVTDANFDPERTHGSSHRGTAYLNHDTKYPPWTASQGMEGGLIQPEETLEIFGKGDHMSKKDINIFGADKDISILGAHDKGLDVLGATTPAAKAAAATRKPATLSGKVAAAKAGATPRAGFVVKKTPAGKKVTSLVLNTPKKGDHKSSIKNAKEAGARAVSIGKKLQSAIAKGKANPASKAAAHSPAPHATAVHGAAAPARKAFSTKPAPSKKAHKPMSPAQIKKVADKAIKVGSKVLKSADGHAKFLTSAQGKLKAGIAATRAKYGPAGVKGTQVRGDADLEVLGNLLGAYCEVLGDEAEDAASDLDLATMADESEMGAPPTSISPLGPGEYFPDPNPSGGDESIYSFSGDLPAGAIVYNKDDKSLPWQGVGSYTRFFPSADKSDGHDNSGFQWGGGDPGIMDGWYWWWHGATSGTEYKHEKAGNTIDAPRAGVVGYQGSDSNPLRSKTSNDLGWGPLVGNPNGWTKGLRYDSAGDRWFWFYDTAPEWARKNAPVIGDNARLNQAVLDYQAQVAAAAADAAAQAMQDQLDAQAAAELAKQQALEDAATARQQQQEQTEQEHQAALQTVADEQAEASAAKDEERQLAAMERQSQLEEERAAREEERRADLEARMFERQAEIDARAEERQQALEIQAMEAAARLDAMSPPSEESQEEAEASNEEYPDQDSYDDGSSIDNLEDAVLGMDGDENEYGERLRGAERIHNRASHRRG